MPLFSPVEFSCLFVCLSVFMSFYMEAKGPERASLDNCPRQTFKKKFK